MLVLTRKLMEKLFIGGDICVTVVRLEGGQVRLGIEAPREVAVVRAELVPERLATRAKTGPRRRIEPTTSEARPHSANPVARKTHRHRYR
jgi:carbon storage regulator